ncbi:error-prone DNA polymerase [Martelella mediterranea]|uniref:Error-prone DNA polymerase n=1 Tax=Martelella mediterranea DSM 17316 TaxID=1122214 RepID=A0A1U9Z6R0_9HYPH|nr:error-prone DNA polymerase [Martelella mediterranea]AQZ53419.1 Error-prone DNA polymerase [Martelella mediterranea DSM 17316]
MDYAELCVTTNFTFLTGASHPEEMVIRAAELDLAAIAITDRNSLAGVVRAFRALKEIRRKIEKQAEEQSIRLSTHIDPSSRQPAGDARAIPLPPIRRLPRLIVGCRLVLADSPVDFVALPKDKPAYQKLVRLLSLGKRRAQKGECLLYLRDMLEWADGSILIALPQGLENRAEATDHITQAHRRFPGHVFTGAAPRYDGSDAAWFAALTALSHKTGAPMVAVGDVLMHHASRRQLADVLTCMRHHITIDAIGHLALPNAERRLKPAQEMADIFRDHPAAIRRTLEITARLTFELTELSYNYPAEVAHGVAPQARLARLTWEGLRRRNPEGIPARNRELAEKELALVGELGYAAYFLTVHDIIAFARSKGILCQGRGSAANSILCYALGITDVKPEMIGMVFERFVSRHRGEPPDIDVDFEHEEREKVIQYIYKTYGRDHAGLCATVIHFRSRAAIREVGKVMGLSNDVTAALSGQIWGISSKGAEPERLKEVGLDPSDRRLAQTIRLIGEIIDFPRHLSQHVGGFVITEDRLDELCPIENAAMEDRTVIEWDKDDIDALNILKVDVLSLGMLTCLQKCFGLLTQHYNRPLTIAEVPQDDEATYDMLCAADAIGVFQVESRAQMNFLPRMQPREFYDLVIEVAIVRPGPIQGGMVQPYIRRRLGHEKVTYPKEELRGVLEKTKGVPLFQEQAMLIAVVAAGFSPEDADRLRRSLASFRQMGTIGEFEEQFINGMLKNDYELDFAQRCFAQIKGFADYGFPESHAAAFAMLTYVSAWLKCHYPAAFACALLNSQPMGFYAPAQIVRDAREHQVEVRPISVNHSAWDCTLERRADGAYALRLGFRQIKGLKQEDAVWLENARGNGYQTPEDVWLRAGLMPAVLERLAEADAFADAGLSRRDALWRVKAIRAPKPLPLFNDPIDGEHISEPDVILPTMNLGEQVVEDYVATRMSLRAHPMELLRPKMPGLTLHSALATTPLRRVSVSGLVITRQRPGTASGVIFLTLEDETGVSNVVVWKKVYERFRRTVMGGRLLKVTGKLQREGVVVHVIAETIEDCSWRLSELGHPMDDAIGITDPKADDTPRRPKLQPRAHHPREQAKRLFPSRDFH